MSDQADIKNEAAFIRTLNGNCDEGRALLRVLGAIAEMDLPLLIALGWMPDRVGYGPEMLRAEIAQTRLREEISDLRESLRLEREAHAETAERVLQEMNATSKEREAREAAEANYRTLYFETAAEREKSRETETAAWALLELLNERNDNERGEDWTDSELGDACDALESTLAQTQEKP